MPENALYPRFLKDRLEEALKDTPVVLIHGPRQCGKTTLAKMQGAELGYDYFSFDDDGLKEAAAEDPQGFVGNLPEKVILDEVQRTPELFSAIKLLVDRDRKPGRFILTGSANILTIPKLSDSLAGRMEILRLWPLSQSEMLGSKPGFIEKLFTADFKIESTKRMGIELAEKIVGGGFPAALARQTERRRENWYRDYTDTLIQRDIQDLARIQHLEALPKLVQLLAGQSAQLLNISKLASPFEISNPTIKEYVTLLKRLFLVDELQPWFSNRMSRLVKSPKIHLGDTGLACSLLGLDADSLMEERSMFGQLLESFVYQELRKLASWHEERLDFFHLRGKDGMEVDFVLERKGREIAGIEVKASATAKSSDFYGLRKLQQALGKRFKCGIVLYDGETVIPFGGQLFAIPISLLWK
ncbi:ATP-binding protein [Puniceicoccales bacterium CK1056]|uniref:ATP-binding protein n=1 Tax=Oceanipulchritudo coccoides TaxID=2706888 RepID=A0A6B2M6X8_9BACT|nr:ATP-binding protein [Oceanipulchritudo coccoides]NDV63400.1 ATP-binding protein [Oceanipulchritudo coccoides]